MYRLYFCAGTAAFGPQAVLEGAGLPHELVIIDTAAGAQRRPDYLAINPLGNVPALITPEGEVLYETAAVMLYLADRHGLEDLAPPVGHALRGLFYRSLFYLSNTLQTDYKRDYYPERFSTDAADAPRIKTKARETLAESWRLVEAQRRRTLSPGRALQPGRHLLGDAGHMVRAHRGAAVGLPGGGTLFRTGRRAARRAALPGTAGRGRQRRQMTPASLTIPC